MDEPTIQDLNRRFRGKDCPTDVLSFPQAPESGLLGDVILCEPYLRRQAEALGHPAQAEAEWLFVHGLLHLLGHADDTEEGTESMRLLGLAVFGNLGELPPATVTR